MSPRWHDEIKKQEKEKKISEDEQRHAVRTKSKKLTDDYVKKSMSCWPPKKKTL